MQDSRHRKRCEIKTMINNASLCSWEKQDTKEEAHSATELSSPGFSTPGTPPPSLPLAWIWCLSFPHRSINLTTNTGRPKCMAFRVFFKMSHKQFSATFCLFDLQFLQSLQWSTYMKNVHPSVLSLCGSMTRSQRKPAVHSLADGRSVTSTCSAWQRRSTEHSCKQLLLPGKRAFQVRNKEGTCLAMGAAHLQCPPHMLKSISTRTIPVSTPINTALRQLPSHVHANTRHGRASWFGQSHGRAMYLPGICISLIMLST